MNLSEFLEKHKDLSTYKSGVYDLMAKSVRQAMRHNSRSDYSDLYVEKAPNEEQRFLDWKKAVTRQITVGYIINARRTIRRVLSQAIKIKEDWKDLERYVYDHVIDQCHVDSNKKIIYWPYVESNPEIAPASPRFVESLSIKTERKEIEYDQIVVNNQDFFIYKLDSVQVEGGEKGSKKNRFVAIDKTGYYILTPYKKQESTAWRQDTWYLHEMGIVPVVQVPGIKQYPKNPITKEIECYNEPFFWPAYEWFDEAATRFSNEQVASHKHAHPHKIIQGKLKCPTCDGSNFVQGKDGKQSVKCGTCDGGNLTILSEFTDIHIDEKHLPGDSRNPSPISYLSPPSGLKEMQDSFLLFLNLGHNTLCTNPLENTGNESALKGDLRLQPKQDLMVDFGKQVCYMLEDLINFKNVLEGDARSEQDLVRIVPPEHYEVRHPDVIRQNFMDSLPGERFGEYMAMINAKHRGNDIDIKIRKYAYLYAPLTLYKEGEADTSLGQMAYDGLDIIRRDYAIYAMTEVFKLQPNLDNDKQIMDAADKFLRDNGYLPEALPSIGNEDEEIAALLDVGGGDTDELKKRLDAFGVGVRAGVITPTLDDESRFREQLGLMQPNELVKNTWEEDGGTRRPITIKSIDQVEIEESKIDDK